jgi:hypothetical protein
MTPKEMVLMSLTFLWSYHLENHIHCICLSPIVRPIPFLSPISDEVRYIHQADLLRIYQNLTQLL